jgi:hypothetical protein
MGWCLSRLFPVRLSLPFLLLSRYPQPTSSNPISSFLNSQLSSNSFSYKLIPSNTILLSHIHRPPFHHSDFHVPLPQDLVPSNSIFLTPHLPPPFPISLKPNLPPTLLLLHSYTNSHPQQKSQSLARSYKLPTSCKARIRCPSKVRDEREDEVERGGRGVC